MSEPIIVAKNLSKYFVNKRDLLNRPTRVVKAVDGVSFEIERGTTLGVVGESGCGKSTLGRTLLRLFEPTKGEIIFNGRHIENLSQNELRPMRKEMQMILQDPYASLNPMRTVFDIVKEALVVQDIGTAKERDEIVAEILNTVSLTKKQYFKFPHEMSGGQRQRVAIARAVITNPSFVVCDEPVSALDASVRAQVLNLLNDIQNRKKLTYMFISHDMSVVRHISDRVMVMYLGKVVEVADKNELFSNPLYPYTKVLLSAIPIPDTHVKKQRLFMEGEIPSPLNPPSGCRLHTRCPYACKECSEIEQELKDVGGGHYVACHRYKEFN